MRTSKKPGRRYFFGFSAFALGLALLLVSGQRTVLAAASIQVQPAAGPPGSSIVITGSGFRPNDTVLLGWDPGQQDQAFFGNLNSDAAGDFSSTERVPAGAAPGPHQVIAQGPGEAAQTQFTVTSEPVTQPTPLGVAPSPNATVVVIPAATSGSSTPVLLVALLGVVGVGIAALWFFFFRRRGDGATGVLKDPCAQLLDDCDQARAAAKAAADAAAASAAAAAQAQAGCDQAKAATAAAAAAAAAAEGGGDSSAWAEGGEGSPHPGARETRYDLQLMHEAEQAGEKIDRNDPATWARLRERAKQRAQQKLKDLQAAEAAACAAAQAAADAAAVAAAAAAAAQAKADELCAKADECRKQQQASNPTPHATTGGATDGGGASSGGPAGGGAAGGKPGGTGGGKKITTGGGCPEGAIKKEKKCEVEVDLYLLGGAQLKIDGPYIAGEGEAQQIIAGLNKAKETIDIAVGLIGAVTDPVGTILGMLHVPTFDTVTGAPTDAAMEAVSKLAENLKGKRQAGEWTLSCPKQHYRFYCEITLECRGGAWVVIDRHVGCQKIGTATFEDSKPFFVTDPAAQAQEAISTMSTTFLSKNKAAEAKIQDCAQMCGA